MDTVDPERRSQIMARIRSKNTKPEQIVRKIAYGLGYRYRLHCKDVPGKPDLTFKSRKKAIFVHGCFWHVHKGCKRGNTPKSNVKYWEKKLKRNIERDHANLEKLYSEGWNVLIIWECETKDPDSIAKKIVDFLGAK